jgi:hypothetical protein
MHVNAGIIKYDSILTEDAGIPQPLNEVLDTLSFTLQIIVRRTDENTW